MDLLVKEFEFCFGISVGVEKVQAFLELVSERAFEQFFHPAEGHGPVSIHGVERRDGGPHLGEQGTDVVGLVGVAGLTDVHAVLKVRVGLDVNAPKVGAGSQHVRHAVNRGCDR